MITVDDVIVICRRVLRLMNRLLFLSARLQSVLRLPQKGLVHNFTNINFIYI